MTLTVAATPEPVDWPLGFGGGVTILRPTELKDVVRTAAERILHKTRPRMSPFPAPFGAG